MLVGHQAVGPLDHPAEKAPGNVLIEHPVAILREHCRRPPRLLHRQADEPPKQQVVIELLHQQSLAANRIEDLEAIAPAAGVLAGPTADRLPHTDGHTQGTWHAARHPSGRESPVTDGPSGCAARGTYS